MNEWFHPLGFTVAAVVFLVVMGVLLWIMIKEFKDT